jgi:hypothetical protein
MLAKLTRWIEAGLPVELPLVTLLKARQRNQSAGVIGVPAHAGAFQTRRGGLAHRFGRAARSGWRRFAGRRCHACFSSWHRRESSLVAVW